jgi:soluble lytic murein transglycosylase-like protein
VLQESSGNPRARRYEPALDKVADGDTLRVDDVAFEDDASWGLLQVLGWNLRAAVGVPRGVRMSFEWALDPALGLIFGVKHLITECLIPTGGDVARALARYNGGPNGTSLVPGPQGVGLVLRRQDYIDAVKRRIPRVIEDRR